MKIKSIPKKVVKWLLALMGDKATAWIFKILPYKHTHISKEDWDAQYADNRWSYLKQIGDLAHYSVIVGYCHYFKQSGTILDIGCGEGMLQDKLRHYRYTRYVGIDISAEAIRLASKKQDERTTFIRVEASKYNSNEKFNIIIFNECLYYFKDPLSLLRKYERFLEEEGLLIISMYVNEMNKKIWNILENFYTSEDEVFVKHKSGTSWIIKVFKIFRGSVD